MATSIKATKASKVLSPDGITLIHLKHLGPGGINFFTVVINLSISSSIIQGLWKVGCIILLLKSGKLAKNSKSFLPIALLSPVAKVVERLLLPEVQEHLHLWQTTSMASVQDVQLPLCLTSQCKKISTGFKRPKPADGTALVALDPTAALTLSISRCSWRTSKPPAYKLFQKVAVLVPQGAHMRKVQQGVPQGGEL